MEKLDLQTPDIASGNIEKIAALFPNCVTESRDADGAVRPVVNFDLLRQELSGVVVDGPAERYRLNWP